MLRLIVPSNQFNSLIPLFWTAKYSQLHRDAHLLYSIKVSNLSGVTFAYSQSDFFRSPGRATFGGFWPSVGNQKVDKENALLAYTNFINEFPLQKEFKIVLPPEIFVPEVFNPQREALLEFQLRNCIVDINYHVEIENWSRKRLSKGNRKKIRQFMELGGSISYASSRDIIECYEVLVQNRRRREVSLSMTYQDFERSLLLLNDCFSLIRASVHGKIIATAYIVKILPSYWYVLYWGELPEFRSLSPVAAIYDFIVNQSLCNNVEILDLGISTVNGVLDEGLARFKSNLGAVATKKMTLILDLNPIAKQK